ncbi:MAG: APC family permease [Gammaproteobacteria bacterium]|nr:APC family permease [Gammaproteobacteria bacterium]
MKLKRSIGPIGLMFTAISGILGSAWLFSPFYAAQIAGPAALLSWIIGGLAMMMIALTFAELICLFPISGGNARFIYFSHGVLSSFLFSWIMWLGYAAVAPAETMGVLQYLASEFPSLVVQKNHITVLSTPGYWVAALVLLGMCIINFLSIKWLSRYNSIIVWVKMTVPVIVAISLLMLSFNIHNFTHFGGFAPYGFKGVASALSVGGVIFAFAGYAPAIVLAGEAKNPQKVIPLVLAGALIICFLLYFLLEVCFIGAQAPGSLTQGWHSLHFAGDSSPFVGMADQLGMHWLRYLILVTAVITPLGTAIIFIATSSRVAYAMSQNGYFPHALLYLNKKGVPIIAVLLNFVVGMLLFFPSPGWQGMVGFLVSAFVLCYALGPISVLALRSQIPDQHRPFRLPWPKLWSFVALSIANLIVYWTGWAIYSEMCIAILLGVIVLIIMRYTRSTKITLDFKNAIWAIVYLAGMAVFSYLGNYGGGKGVLPINWDVLMIAVFSLGILYWSWLSRLPVDRAQVYIASIVEEG